MMNRVCLAALEELPNSVDRVTPFNATEGMPTFQGIPVDLTDGRWLDLVYTLLQAAGIHHTPPVSCTAWPMGDGALRFAVWA